MDQILVKWSQQGDVIVIRIIGGVARFEDDEIGEHTIMTVARRCGDDEGFECYTLFGKLSVDDMIEQAVHNDESCQVFLYASTVQQGVTPWPRLLATPGKHPRVSVDWTMWDTPDDDYT